MNSRWCLCSVPLKILVLKSTCNDSFKILLFNENTGTAIMTMKSTERNTELSSNSFTPKLVLFNQAKWTDWKKEATSLSGTEPNQSVNLGRTESQTGITGPGTSGSWERPFPGYLFLICSRAFYDSGNQSHRGEVICHTRVLGRTPDLKQLLSIILIVLEELPCSNIHFSQKQDFWKRIWVRHLRLYFSLSVSSSSSSAQSWVLKE